MESQCEFCGETEEVETTAFVGFYCRRCHKLVISESQKAIREIAKREGTQSKSKKKHTTKSEFEKAREDLLRGMAE